MPTWMFPARAAARVAQPCLDILFRRLPALALGEFGRFEQPPGSQAGVAMGRDDEAALDDVAQRRRDPGPHGKRQQTNRMEIFRARFGKLMRVSP